MIFYHESPLPNRGGGFCFLIKAVVSNGFIKRCIRTRLKKRELPHYLMRQPLFVFWWGAEGNGRAVSNVCVSAAGLGAWCPSTKEQGFAGSEAPRRIGGRPVRARGRGARRRRNKGLQGVKHHAGLEEGRFGSGGVVLVDEGTRVCDMLPL